MQSPESLEQFFIDLSVHFLHALAVRFAKPERDFKSKIAALFAAVIIMRQDEPQSIVVLPLQLAALTTQGLERFVLPSPEPLGFRPSCSIRRVQSWTSLCARSAKRQDSLVLFETTRISLQQETWPCVNLPNSLRWRS